MLKLSPKMKKEAKKLPKNTAKDNQSIDDFFNKTFQKMNINKPT